jgi:two-component system, cell cycle sensor histidine kinase and response regulator CckA
LKTLRQILAGGSNLKVAIAVTALAVCFSLLLVKVYRAQTELRESVLKNFKQDLEKQAADWSYFYSERRNDLKNLTAQREVSIFFENKALGRSMESGLKASLIAIQESLDLVLKERVLGQERIYTRFVFADSSGECLIDTQSNPGLDSQAKKCGEFLTPGGSAPIILVKRLNGVAELIVSSPCFFKGTFSGQIIAWISTETVQKHLIGADSQLHNKIVRAFSSQGNFYLPAHADGPAISSVLPDIASLGDREYFDFKMANGVEMISTWTPIKDTPLYLVGVIPAHELFGYLSPWHLAILVPLSVLSLLGVAVAWWTHTRNLILQARLEEAALRQQEVGEKNRQLEEEILERKEAEELSRNLLTASPIGIYIMQDGKFRIANQRFHEITSFGKDELPLMDPAALIHPDDRDEAREKAARMLGGESSTPYEYRVVARDGKIKWIMESVIPANYQGKEAVLGFSMDITGHKELEKQFLQAQKMEAVGRLAGGVAHDFNNMLGAIIGYTEMLMQRLNQADPTYHYGEEIRKAAERAAILTRQLLAFSRKQVVQPQKLNLNTVIGDLEKMLRRLIGEDVALLLHLDPTLAAVKADFGQMEQIILNLAVNARDAMPQGGKLAISTANINLDEAYPQKQADFRAGLYIVVTVSDSGLGMDGETLDHIFEPFYTTKALGSGTGLGLSTVYGIIKQSGGFIEVASERGVGTTFKIYLPASGEAAEPVEVMSAEAEPLRGSETVLLVEDEEILRQLIKDALEANGYRVLEARDGREAVMICEQHQEPIDLMLTDVVMPQMNGRELAQRLAQLRPKIKVVYMSGYAEDVLFRQGVLDPSITFLQKPFRQYEMTAKVRKVLDARLEG